MKRQLEVPCNAKCNKKVKGDGLPNNDYDNKPTTSTTLTEAEKKARRAEYQRNYRRRIKEEQQKQQQQQQVVVTLNETCNRPTSSPTIKTEAERKARNAEYNRKYRQQIKEREQQQQQENARLDVISNRPTTSKTITEAERKARNTENKCNYRKQCKEQWQLQPQEGVTFHAAVTETEIQQQERNIPNVTQNEDLDAATRKFNSKFHDNPLGAVCGMCDRIWFKNELKVPPSRCIPLLAAEFTDENVENFKVCANCCRTVTDRVKPRIPTLSTSNGFAYVQYPKNLPPLDCISERLISPRIPFMQI
jgi:hypothetical protein